MAARNRGKRRSYSKAFKRRVVAETLEPGASVAAVARLHGLNANMVFLWFDAHLWEFDFDDRCYGQPAQPT